MRYIFILQINADGLGTLVATLKGKADGAGLAQAIDDTFKDLEKLLL
jgi:hypothetical protein